MLFRLLRALLSRGRSRGAEAAGADPRNSPAAADDAHLAVDTTAGFLAGLRTEPFPRLLDDVALGEPAAREPSCIVLAGCGPNSFRDFALYVAVTIPILKLTLAIDVTTLLGTSAVVSLVLGFALQDTLSNLFSGLSMQLEQSFAIGDFISVGIHTGRVTQIAWRSTRIETFRNEQVTLPNSLVAKEAVKNFSRGGLPICLSSS